MFNTRKICSVKSQHEFLDFKEISIKGNTWDVPRDSVLVPRGPRNL